MSELTPKQVKAIAAIIASPSYEQAAQKTGVTSRQMRRWRHDPVFAAALKEAQGELIEDACRILLIAARPAAQRLLRIMASGDDGKALRAAAVLLAEAHKWHSLNDIEARLLALEHEISTQAVEVTP